MTSSPPPLPEQLAAMARETVADEQLLERYAAQALSPAERLELERRAELDSGLRAALALYRPLDAASRDATVERVMATSTSARKRRIAAGALVAVAASLTAFAFFAQGQAAVAYQLEASGESTGRGSTIDNATAAAADSPVIALTEGSTLKLVARPAKDVDGPVSARVYIKNLGATDVTWVDLPVEVSPGGAVRFEAAVEKLLPSRGRYVVGLDLGHQLGRVETRVEWKP